jgi:hypothetical protein
MTWGKAAAWTAGVVGVAALGFVYGPSLMDRNDRIDPNPVVSVAPAEEPKPTAKPRRRVVKERPAEERMAETIARPPVEVAAATDPDLHARLNPVLNKGAKMEIAAEGFADGEQFAMVAHAARNTKVPFMVLKHRIVNEGQTLAQAIAASKPELDARYEAERARNAAHYDLEVIASN